MLDVEQCSAGLKEFDDLWIGFEHAEASEMLDLACEFTCRIDRSIDLKPVLLADGKVIRTVAGSRVNAARAGFSGGRLP